MPELPEVETARRGITPHILNKTVSKVTVRNGALRWPVPSDLSDLLVNKKLLSIGRRGKYLLLEFSHGIVLLHLGMSGNLRIVDDKREVLKHDHVDVVFSKHCILRFNDPRRFGCVLWTQGDIAHHKLIASMGPEPLSREFTSDYLYIKSRKSETCVKNWVMNSKTVVGVGNIYANESLFEAHIHPMKKTGRLSKDDCEMLVSAIKQILSKAIEKGGTTLKDFVASDGKPGYFTQDLKVYGRAGQPCIACGKSLTERLIAQRSSVYCTACQN